MAYTNQQLRTISQNFKEGECFVKEIIQELKHLQIFYGQYLEFPIQKWIEHFREWNFGPSDLNILDSIIENLESYDEKRIDRILKELDVDEIDIPEDTPEQMTIKSNIEQKVNYLKLMINNERMRSALILQNNSDNTIPEDKIPPNQCAWGHVIGKKMIKMLKAFYRSMNSYTIIKGFARCGLCSYEISDGDYRTYLDLNKATRLLETFIDIRSMEEWTMIERERLILLKAVSKQREDSFIHVDVLPQYVPDDTMKYPSPIVQGPENRKISVFKCNLYRPLGLSADEKLEITMKIKEDAEKYLSQPHVKQTLEEIRQLPVEPLKFPKRLFIIQDVEKLPKRLLERYPIAQHTTESRYCDGYQDLTDDKFQEMMNQPNIRRNDLGYPIMDPTFSHPLEITDTMEEDNEPNGEFDNQFLYDQDGMSEDSDDTEEVRESLRFRTNPTNERRRTRSLSPSLQDEGPRQSRPPSFRTKSYRRSSKTIFTRMKNKTKKKRLSSGIVNKGPRNSGKNVPVMSERTKRHKNRKKGTIERWKMWKASMNK